MSTFRRLTVHEWVNVLQGEAESNRAATERREKAVRELVEATRSAAPHHRDGAPCWCVMPFDGFRAQTPHGEDCTRLRAALAAVRETE